MAKVSLVRFQTFKQSRPADWPHVSAAGDCPAELREPLKEPVFL
jgi:hypothetical protein